MNPFDPQEVEYWNLWASREPSILSSLEDILRPQPRTSREWTSEDDVAFQVWAGKQTLAE